MTQNHQSLSRLRIWLMGIYAVGRHSRQMEWTLGEIGAQEIVTGSRFMCQVNS